MPSPIGHALAGLAAGWLVQPVPILPSRAAAIRRICLFAAAGAAPDLDLLVGAHSGPTHGLGAAAIVGIAMWAATHVASRFQTRESRRASGASPTTGAGRQATELAVAVAVAYATHTLLDWLGTDTSAPIGIMALWPFNRTYYESAAHVFMAISRRYWLPEFWTSNLFAIGRELVILLPIAAACLFIRRPSIAVAAPRMRA